MVNGYTPLFALLLVNVVVLINVHVTGGVSSLVECLSHSVPLDEALVNSE